MSGSELRVTLVEISPRELGYLSDCLTEVDSPVRLATLGPAGTSSEHVARRLSSRIERSGCRALAVELEDSYEACHDRVRQGTADLALVAHAYSGINSFYMDPALQPVSIFRADTPDYGLAVRPGFELRPEALRHLRVVSHPAPIPLLAHHYGTEASAVVTTSSTSAAALSVATGEFDVAITNEEAAAAHGLELVRRFYPIPMTWTLFAEKKGAER